MSSKIQIQPQPHTIAFKINNFASLSVIAVYQYSFFYLANAKLIKTPIGHISRELTIGVILNIGMDELQKYRRLSGSLKYYPIKSDINSTFSISN